MSSDEYTLKLDGVWKKYSTTDFFHKSIREEIVGLFNRKKDDTLSKDEFWALRDINLEFKQGDVVGLYGTNGAGKTTILKIISSITYPTIGSITVNGTVAPLIEVGAGFHPDLTGRENIYVNGTIIGMQIKEIKEKMDNIIAFSELAAFIDMPVKKYSSGMYLRLGFAIAVNSSAGILLFDEIMSVSDGAFQQKCIDKIKELKRENRTIVMVSHNLSLLRETADKIYLIKDSTAVPMSAG
ncbi:ABC transporter ATP-binding protein [Candidatus Magnetominusculus xianensis]|uniref:ABC transporter n=1 Tax=Candidatus Magnetominusculus xianensis TaxID=1748249 RepID=A0ABR5SHQ9_9BACT|nr:ABC transporter ATP-binding protein [Candidatus Magnetominusculus xianensis]KWT89414.1 ABC transporter [Candidatus Magnetominusculus xianensis]MBF0405503.1 ABC transporter ATP-binding protein [Nitrospirota bacterium]